MQKYLDSRSQDKKNKRVDRGEDTEMQRSSQQDRDRGKYNLIKVYVDFDFDVKGGKGGGEPRGVPESKSNQRPSLHNPNKAITRGKSSG